MVKVGAPYRVSYNPKTGRLRILFFHPTAKEGKFIFPEAVVAVLNSGILWGVTRFLGCCLEDSRFPGKMCLVFQTAKGGREDIEVAIPAAKETLRLIYRRRPGKGRRR